MEEVSIKGIEEGTGEGWVKVQVKDGGRINKEDGGRHRRRIEKGSG